MTEKKKSTKKFLIPKKMRSDNHLLTAVNVLCYTLKDKGVFVNYNDHLGKKVIITVQDGPIKDNGINGIQVDDIIKLSGYLLSSLNNSFPCSENKEAMWHLNEALKLLGKRKKDRKKRGVEGLNKL